VLKDFSAMLRLQPLASCVNITLDLGAEDDRVAADANQLRQVFLNLVMNAIDAIDSENRPEKGSIRIASSRICREGLFFVEVRVIDDGPGIPGDILKNIFDPFFTTKDPGKGTGLGLSVCFTIIEGMGGSIQAASEVHAGTTFVVQLPIFIHSK
jgi:two-component system NtrC family sensor kinase